jgi:ABC-2 type transport system permease protein
MNIFKLDFKRNLKTLLTWAGASGAVLALIMLMYPAMMKSDFIDMLNAKISMFPKELIDMLNMSGQDIRQLPQFFANIFQFVLMAACIYGAILGINALSREESEKTIEFLYSKPVKRIRIVSAKLAAACMEYLAYFVIVGAAGMLACVCVRPADLSMADLVQPLKNVLFGGMVTGFVYLFIGFAISVFLKRPRHPAPIAVALFFGTYILGTISSLGMLQFLKWVSPMNYFIPRNVVMSGIDWTNALICALALAACTAVSYIVYSEKDFLV